jgi:hypothetical protein
MVDEVGIVDIVDKVIKLFLYHLHRKRHRIPAAQAQRGNALLQIAPLQLI